MRTTRLTGAVLVAAAFAVAVPETATAASRAKAPSSKFCNAFADYFKATFRVQLVAAFAEGLGGDKGKQAAEEVRRIFYLVLSPQLEQLTNDLEATSPNKVARRAFGAQSKVFADGSDLLVEAGLTRRQVKQLAGIDIDANTDVDELLGHVDIKKRDVEAAAKKFAPRVETLDELSGPEQRQFLDLGSRCGVLPDRSIGCKQVVDDADVVAIIGPIVTREDKSGSCTFESAENADGDVSKVAVDVYASRRAFDTVTENAKNQDVPDVGDRAVALEGMNTFSGISTCGRTIVARQGDRTVVGAACVRNGDVDVATLTTLVKDVLAKVGSA